MTNQLTSPGTVLAKDRAWADTMRPLVHGDVIVLLLDDDPFVIDGVLTGLSNHGFQVYTATDVASAIRQEALHRPTSSSLT